jgi:hypothetical protein
MPMLCLCDSINDHGPPHEKLRTYILTYQVSDKVTVIKYLNEYYILISGIISKKEKNTEYSGVFSYMTDDMRKMYHVCMYFGCILSF